MIRILAVVAALLCIAPAIAQPLPANLDKANAIVIDTTKGRIVIKLRTDIAPGHAERIKQLAREGYYNNVPFHRVMDGFMAQTGDGQNFNGTGGSKYPNLKAEFSNVPFKRGIVGMARRGDSNDSANSQFFIMFADGLEPERPVHRDRRSGVGNGRGRQIEEGPAGLVGRRGDRSRQDGEGPSRIRYQVSRGAAAQQASLVVCSAASDACMDRAVSGRTGSAQHPQGRLRETPKSAGNRRRRRKPTRSTSRWSSASTARALSSAIPGSPMNRNRPATTTGSRTGSR